ncbi:hypothetical protein SXCC_00635 [Gluconacetobacter sp. SXCC-1]|uniref:Uncharacterized protein n=1 Tax=Novacetimonas maltaceti TaxID=1203393 RepID=A0A2S3VY71_9PROT|nr:MULTISPECIES: hypothetical protein [Acetobacteraceae]EGG78654.1 hypothetical protein SXCC_00635 [Gluconacetobacter sp. SXCC-1]POF61584.1 hypothetical protein KMAL_28030 [Novacetimonas maltaceti]PYD58592.1 hypothetical protein CFR73_14470 [Novacetimonas maltaceti]GCE89055.1 hypothetical protein MSKU15_0656 [Komagataeibacter diospyri]
MANSLYSVFLQQALTKNIDVTDGSIRLALLDNSYSFNAGDADTTSALKALVGAAVAPSAAVTVAGGSVTIPAATFAAIASGTTVQAVLVYSGTTPIAYIDTATGIPASTDGSTITVSWTAAAITLGLTAS